MTGTQRNGIGMIVSGIAGGAFFWLTDPRWTVVGRRMAGDSSLDAVHELSAGTYVGVAGSAIVLLLGIWLVTRRTN